MATWNLHIVGEKVIEELDTIAKAIVDALEAEGHQLVSAILTSDEGSKDIAVTPPPAEEPAPAEPPAEPAPDAPAPDVPTDTPPTPPETGTTETVA